MKLYAIKQLVPEPSITVEVTMDDNEQPIVGEQRYLTIPNEKTILGEVDTQSAYNTTVTVVGYTWYPFDPSQGTDITFDNIQASILHYQERSIKQITSAVLDRIYYSDSDPSVNRRMRNGNMWVRLIQSDGGGDKNDRNESTVKQRNGKSKSNK